MVGKQSNTDVLDFSGVMIRASASQLVNLGLITLLCQRI